jgi:hypothetical protein
MPRFKIGYGYAFEERLAKVAHQGFWIGWPESV